jgi:hypothetical protein
MGSRLEFEAVLKNILGSNYVYFQPPPSFKMTYPCIVYNSNGIVTKSAGNKPYLKNKRYSVSVIDSDPDSVVPDKIASLPKSYFDRHYVADNLNHDVFNVYY